MEQHSKKANNQKKARSSQSAYIAKALSEISNPLFVALPTFLAISLARAPDVVHALLWWVIAGLGVSIGPLLFVQAGVRSGRYTDHHVSVREQRFLPLIFGIGCVLGAFLLLYVLGAARVLIATVAAVIVVLLIVVGITRFWKISLHLVGIAGCVTVFVLLFGLRFLLLSPLIVFVGWARWRVGAHTLLQALAGTLLAVSVTVVLFWMFGILV